MTPTRFYLAVTAALDRRIRSLRWPMWQVDERSRLNAGHTAHVLHPDTKNGRQAQWKTLQKLVDALYPGGFKVAIIARKRNMPALAGIVADGPTPARAAMYVPTPQKAREMVILRVNSQSPRRRKQIARMAANARWHRRRIEAGKIDDG
ncbi:MAG: hypothetical protein Q7R45_07230 [Sulfuricaulis sp.]|nr:hypothetical protein [Sulfuricaulis sp.]